ncbi:TSC22 domain family protein 2 isoform X2 [Epinephelus fuscoguttatus]|uniref:TSC22 domain family protein 2 isoform X2 n=1 Tax=Epinephelus fuscoguttatus TaxID=293821 RepID=UPI0020D148D5|nr:TSC22 domain family protein 2 isoform X2 [Epinephelus fuscoguttatus]
MSKMPAKKKSCFQITSVTQAQVAASSITDDTESLDDPDESRTEDVSSEIFDVSRADLGVCERSSSEETLNNVGEPQEGQPPSTGPVNGGLSYKSLGTGRVTPHNLGGSVPVPATTQPIVPSSATHPSTATSTVPAATVSTSVAHTAPVNTSCSSRFRVIKLDHGTGEPFRRGRWTCTEFYERDSDSNVNRTVDSIKPAVIHDHSIDRDSGLGATSNSVVTSSAFSAQASDNSGDSGHSTMHPAHPYPQEPLQPGYSLAPRIGSGASAFQPTGYTTTASQQQAQVNMQPVAPQTFLSNSLNGVHHGAMHQKSPIMPPASQAQQYAYSTHPTGHSAGQADYRQQHFVSSTQSLPMSAHPVGHPTSQVPSPLITPAGPGAQGLAGEAASAQPLQPLLLQVGNTSAMAPIPPGSSQQQHVSIAPAPSIATTTSHSGVQNTPTTVPSTTIAPPGVPSQAPGTGGLVKPHGAHGGATTVLPSVFNNQAEDSRQKSDALPQPGAVVVPGKDGVKPFISEGLGLPTPAVNSLFGIHITMDVDEDSASGASVVAIDNKIEQAMDLVKSHLMYAVREEVEVLKEQIKELYERNSVLERENAVLKSLANADQLGQLTNQLNQGSSTSPPLQQQHQHPLVTNNNNNTAPSAHHEGSQSIPHQPNITSA